MEVNLLNEGDKVLSVTNEFIVIERGDGKVEMIPFEYSNKGLQIHEDQTITIGFNEVTVFDESGVTITTF